MAAAVGGVVVLAGCADGQPEPELSEELVTAFRIQANSEIRRAEEFGVASERQIEILERARDEGVMSQSLAREAMQNFFECLAGHGMSFTDLGTAGRGEFARLDFLFNPGDDLATADQCDFAEFSAVSSLYQAQPAAMAERRTITEAAIPDLHACLNDAGYELPPNPTFDETMSLVFHAMTGHWLFDEPVDAPALGHQVDCISVVGLDHGEIEWAEPRPRPGS